MNIPSVKLPKINFSTEKIRSVEFKSVKKLPENEIFIAVCYAGLVWLVNYIFSEIVISGGIYERSPYLILLNAIIVFTLIQYIPRKSPGTTQKRIKMAIVYFITFIVLDYLLIFWLLEKQQLSYFQFWGTWVVYAVAVGALFAKGKKIKIPAFPSRKKRLDQINSQFQSLDKR
jgi:apolipoprotein N-acyltransferase